MRLAHKRNVQRKLNKYIKAASANIQANMPKPAAKASVVKTATASAQVKQAVASAAQSLNLTPKQQSIYDVLKANADGMSPKNIGLAAGQEDSKAAAWASSGLRKMLEENLVIKEQLAGNKVSYKIA